MLRKSLDRVELSGRSRTASSFLQWSAASIPGRFTVPPVVTNESSSRTVWSAETWSGLRGRTFVLTISCDHESRPHEDGLPGAMSLSSDGVAVDVAVTSKGTSMRVLGIASTSKPLELWSDDEFPRLADHCLELSLHTDDFWLGLFTLIDET